MAPTPLNVVTAPRTPAVVQAVTILWALMLIATGVTMIVGLMAVAFADRTTYTSCALSAPLFALVLWFGLHLRSRTKLAWKTQVVLSIIGMCGFPLGTIINTLIIAAWFSPETKAWFGVDQPPRKRIHS